MKVYNLATYHHSYFSISKDNKVCTKLGYEYREEFQKAYRKYSERELTRVVTDETNTAITKQYILPCEFQAIYQNYVSKVSKVLERELGL